MKRRAVTRLQTRTYALRRVTSEANLTPIFDFDVNKMFINTIWKLFNVNNTRRTCVTFARVESIKTARTNCECWGEYRKAPCLTCIPSRNTTSPEMTSTTFDVGTGLMTSSKPSRTGLKRREVAAETWKTLRVTSQKLNQRSPPPDLPDRVGTAGDANMESFSVKAINTHFRTKGREIGTKTNQRAKQGTISRQFGPPNSGQKSGSFARFMEFLGPRYLEDARELLGRNTLRRIETEMTKKHKKERKPPPGQGEFIQLSTMVKLLETVLIVLREYPPFDALCRVPGKSDDDCEEPAQESVKKRYEEIDALFNKYDARVSAANLAKPKEGVRVLPFKEIKRRVERAFPRNSQEIPKQNLYINMYAEFVSRDDMKKPSNSPPSDRPRTSTRSNAYDSLRIRCTCRRSLP